MTAYIGADSVTHYPHIRLDPTNAWCDYQNSTTSVLVMRSAEDPIRFEFCTGCYLILRVINNASEKLSDESNRLYHANSGLRHRKILKRGNDFFFVPVTFPSNGEHIPKSRFIQYHLRPGNAVGE